MRSRWSTLYIVPIVEWKADRQCFTRFKSVKRETAQMVKKDLIQPFAVRNAEVGIADRALTAAAQIPAFEADA